jgi:hypothetical protein
MQKDKIKIEQVVEDLKRLFQIGKITEDNASCVSNNEFLIDKRSFERFQVIEMLQEYFKDKMIDGGYLSLDPMTFIHTKFKVCEGKPV